MRGGLIGLRTAPVDDDTDFRVRTTELRGGVASFAFAFNNDGNYSFSANLVNAPRVFGTRVTASTTAAVDVP